MIVFFCVVIGRKLGYRCLDLKYIIHMIIFSVPINRNSLYKIYIDGRCEMSEQKGKLSKGGIIALAICVVVIIILLGLVIFLMLNKEKKEEPIRRNIVVNEKNVDKVIEQLGEERTAPGSYEVTMNTTWNFPSGDAASENAYVKNAEANTNSVYFDVTLEETGETIFESPIIPVGSWLDNITLDSVLEDGIYDCVITYHLLDEEEQSISTVKLTLKIVIGQ